MPISSRANRYVAAIAAAMKSGIPDQKLYKMDEQARADLKKRLAAVLGPQSFQGCRPDAHLLARRAL